MKNTPVLFVALTVAFSFFAPPLEAATQDQWRPCVRCQTMFYNGFPNKGRCPAGGRHAADSRKDVNNYVLKYDVKETPHAGGGHSAAGSSSCSRKKATLIS